ncbi:MAG: FkbM family methyltransferase [Holophagaceae bacterium]|nr:FkbM family methyltransferase [Holophagaceae bacterium]
MPPMIQPVIQPAHWKRAEALRRRIWRILFEDRQQRLGQFFLDPGDHIGSERLITGDCYESVSLQTLDQLRTVLSLGSGMALDVGANIGNHACWMVQRFEHVVCVEPSEIASYVLTANLLSTRTRNWEVVRAALGNCGGHGRLEVASDRNLGSSSAIPTNEAEGEFPVYRGDDLLASRAHSGRRVDLIKIDVEGAEFTVLQGLRGAIATSQPLICIEALDVARWKVVTEWLQTMGYRSFLAHNPKLHSRRLSSRLKALCSGEYWTLSPLSGSFPNEGYEMVYCLTDSMAERFKLP